MSYESEGSQVLNVLNEKKHRYHVFIYQHSGRPGAVVVSSGHHRDSRGDTVVLSGHHRDSRGDTVVLSSSFVTLSGSES